MGYIMGYMKPGHYGRVGRLNLRQCHLCPSPLPGTQLTLDLAASLSCPILLSLLLHRISLRLDFQKKKITHLMSWALILDDLTEGKLNTNFLMSKKGLSICCRVA